MFTTMGEIIFLRMYQFALDPVRFQHRQRKEQALVPHDTRSQNLTRAVSIVLPVRGCINGVVIFYTHGHTVDVLQS